MADHPIEAAAIGGLLMNQDALDEASAWLRPDDFRSTTHRVMYAAALHLRSQGQPADPVLVLAEMKRQREPIAADARTQTYVATIYDHVPSPLAARYYCKELVELAVRRELEFAGMRLQQIGRDGIGDTSTLLRRAREDVWARLADTSNRWDRSLKLPCEQPVIDCGNTPVTGEGEHASQRRIRENEIAGPGDLSR
jgi:replicative DNA helicase